MTSSTYTTPNEKALSGALTLLMHGLFIALLVFGVAWQKSESPPMVAELWGNLPPAPQPRAEPPPPKVEPKPAPPKAEPKPPPPKPVPKAEPKPAPKPDIALREKREKELKAKELAEKKRKEEQALKAKELAEKKKREEQARLEALKLKQEKEAEAKRIREQEEAMRKLVAQQAAARATMVDEFKRRIAEKIKRFITEPLNLQGNPEVELHITVLPGGEVLDVRIVRSSGQPLWDNAAERAVIRAQPLPLPPDPALMREFRELNLRFRPKE